MAAPASVSETPAALAAKLRLALKLMRDVPCGGTFDARELFDQNGDAALSAAR